MAASMQAFLSLFENKENPAPLPDLPVEQTLRLKSSFRNPTHHPGGSAGNGTVSKKTVRMVLPPAPPPTVIIPVPTARQHDFVYSQRRGVRVSFFLLSV
jgi:hypothetical protein